MFNPTGILTDPQSLNLYAYARNNPIKYIDPTGEAVETPTDAAITGFDAIQVIYYVGSGLGDAINYAHGAISDDEYLKQVAREGWEESKKGLKEASFDLAADAVSTAIPGVPAGLTKVARIVNKADDTKKAVNATTILAKNIAETFAGGKYIEEVLQSDTKVWRVFGDIVSESEKKGRYFTDFLPESSQEAIKKLGLPSGNSATKVVQATIPKGTKIFKGAASGIDGRGPGGATQIFIENKNSAKYGEITNLK